MHWLILRGSSYVPRQYSEILEQIPQFNNLRSIFSLTSRTHFPDLIVRCDTSIQKHEGEY